MICCSSSSSSSMITIIITIVHSCYVVFVRIHMLSSLLSANSRVAVVLCLGGGGAAP